MRKGKNSEDEETLKKVIQGTVCVCVSPGACVHTRTGTVKLQEITPFSKSWIYDTQRSREVFKVNKVTSLEIGAFLFF